LIQQRIERAKTLLKQRQLSISDIAAQTGGGEPSHFTKLFRQHTGITPKA
jgi:AraC family transcriptional regulator